MREASHMPEMWMAIGLPDGAQKQVWSRSCSVARAIAGNIGALGEVARGAALAD
jgi:hypothetical protein